MNRPDDMFDLTIPDEALRELAACDLRRETVEGIATVKGWTPISPIQAQRFLRFDGAYLDWIASQRLSSENPHLLIAFYESLLEQSYHTAGGVGVHLVRAGFVEGGLRLFGVAIHLASKQQGHGSLSNPAEEAIAQISADLARAGMFKSATVLSKTIREGSAAHARSLSGILEAAVHSGMPHATLLPMYTALLSMLKDMVAAPYWRIDDPVRAQIFLSLSSAGFHRELQEIIGLEHRRDPFYKLSATLAIAKGILRLAGDVEFDRLADNLARMVVATLDSGFCSSTQVELANAVAFLKEQSYPASTLKEIAELAASKRESFGELVRRMKMHDLLSEVREAANRVLHKGDEADNQDMIQHVLTRADVVGAEDFCEGLRARFLSDAAQICTDAGLAGTALTILGHIRTNHNPRTEAGFALAEGQSAVAEWLVNHDARERGAEVVDAVVNRGVRSETRARLAERLWPHLELRPR